jgi:thioredoxin 1
VSANVRDLDAQTFETDILGGEGLFLVDFWAEWCAPCHTMTPILEELAQEFDSQVTIAKVDSSANPDLTERYQVQSLPTFIFFKDGEVVHRLAGAKRKNMLARELTALNSDS